MLYVEKRILTGFVIVMLILAGLAYYSFVNNKEFAETSAMVAHTNEVLFHLEQSQSVAFEMESLILKYIISGDTIFLTRYKNQAIQGSGHVKKIEALTLDNEIQQSNVDSLRYWGRKKVNYNKQVIQQRKISAALAQKMIPSPSNWRLQISIVNTLERMKKVEGNLLNTRINKMEQSQQKFTITFSFLLVFVMVILSLVVFTLNKSLRARVLAETRTIQVNKELEAFTYSVSHDLRAPLRSIDGYAKVLFEDYGDKIDAEGKRVLTVVMNNAKRMGRLIDDLLEFSRVGRKELNKNTVDMQGLVQNVVREFSSQDQDLIKIEPLLSVTGDYNMLQQVWINLISNAIKYSSKTDQPAIEIQSYREGNEIVYTIRDNGVGFDMQYVNKLFGVFQRLHKAKDFEGTGVGLALVQRIIQKHDGRVWAEGVVNKGAIFYFSLPA